MKTVNIGEKELGLRASPLALLYYKQEFDKDLIADLVKIEDARLTADDLDDLDTVKALQVVYAMNKADNYGKSFPDFEKWLSELESVDFAEAKWLLDALEEAGEGFFRSAGTGSKPEPKTK